MDEDVVVQVENVSKVYQLYDKPQDRLKQALFWRFGKRYGREFWALRDVSFQVRRGETVGIIGRNGSGKSTLLQIIAGTLQPTSGSVQVRGRVAALLELGSGFNPEFTGRENVYMAGSLLGLSDAEVASHFDAIEKFAEIGDFIDQPVKLYSSGMFVRLAFSVQAILPKDILIVDEALAVGDASFQRKCYQRLEQFREQGGTVLLVTHDVQTVVRECQRAVMFDHGEVIEQGLPKHVTDIYYKYLFGNTSHQHKKVSSNPLDSKVLAMIIEERFTDENNFSVSYAECGKDYKFCFDVDLYTERRDVFFAFSIKNTKGVVVAGATTENYLSYGSKFSVAFHMKSINLSPGKYFFSCNAHTVSSIGIQSLARKLDVLELSVVPESSGKKHFWNHGMVNLTSECVVSTL
jgi:lipopolysaccharide transport system ATP-binding protein